MKNVFGAILVATLLWSAPASAAPPAPGAALASKGNLQQQKLDINRATREELESVPGIGPRMAQSIVELRNRKGTFSKLEDLLGVPGIKEKKLEALSSYLAFFATTPGPAGAPGAVNK